MKTQRILYIVAAILGLIVILLFFRNPWETIRSKGKDLALKNSEEIDLFILTNGNDTVRLSKIKKGWEVNQHFDARPRSMNLLLNLLSDIEIISPVSKQKHDMIMNDLREKGKQLAVFRNGKKLRTYYMYSDSLSTFMMLKGSRTPYRVELKGYSGVDLYRLIPLKLDFWRNNVLFNFNPVEIATVEVIYPGKPGASYKIQRENKGYRLYRWNDDQVLKEADEMKILDYLSFFSKVEFTILPDSVRQKVIPMTENKDPIFMMTVISIEGVENTVKAYRMPAGKSGSEEYDTNKFYALINDDSELVIMNYTDFDPLLKTVNYFLKK